MVVSLGHHLADRDTIRAAADAGATAATHLGNGIPNLLPRHPNPLWAQLDEDRLTALIITDGWHLPSGKDADDGRHVVAVDTGALIDEPWERPEFPAAFNRF